MEIIQSNGNNKSFILLGSSCIHFFSRKRDNEHFLFSFVEGRIFQFLQITYLSKMHFKMHFLLQRFFQLRNFQKQCSWRFFFNVVPSVFFFLKSQYSHPQAPLSFITMGSCIFPFHCDTLYPFLFLENLQKAIPAQCRSILK